MTNPHHASILRHRFSGVARRGDSTAFAGSSAPSHRVTRVALLLATAALALLALAPSASAAPTRTYTTSFGSFSGQSPQALAVDQSNGDVYVANVDSSTVARFDSSGAPKNFTCGTCSGNTLAGLTLDFGPGTTQVAVDRSGGPADGNIYVTNSAAFPAAIKVFDNDGTPLGSLTGSGTPDGSFGSVYGVAVDQSSGDLYVANGFGTRVWRYTPSADLVKEGDYDAGITHSGFSAANIAVTADRVYVTQAFAPGNVSAYATSDFAASPPTPTPVIVDPNGSAVATDPSNDDLYVDNGNQVSVYDDNDVLVYTFGSAAEFGTDSPGVAVKGSNGPAYVSDIQAGSNEVDVYSPAADVAPKAKTKPATEVHHTSAVLNGRAVPGADLGGATDPITDCHFEWGTTIAYGNSAPCSEGNSFNVATNVSALVGGLTPGETYHFRLDVSTATSGVVSGGDRTFTPSPFEVLHPEVAAFGPDGTSASSFDGNRFGPLAFAQSTRHLFSLDGNFGSPGEIYGFDASAPTTYPPLAGFNPLPIAPVSNSALLAVDGTALPSAGNVYYVSDVGSGQKIEGFDSTGTPLGGNFPIDPTATPGGAIGSPFDTQSAAVDSAGNLWIANIPTRQILRYSSAGAFLSAVDVSAETNAFAGPYQIAIDTSNDDLYVGTLSGGGVWRYSASSGYTSTNQIDDRAAESIAVDPSTHHVFTSPRDYIDNFKEIREHDSAGNSFGVVAKRPFSPGGTPFLGLAVDGTNHYLYATIFDFNFGTSSFESRIHVYASNIQLVPTLTPGDPSPPTATSTTLNAEVDPEGFAVTDCHFEYVPEAEFDANGFANASDAPCDPDAASIGGGAGNVPVSAAVSGLAPGTLYHYRITASNANGTANGPEQTFTTLGPRIHGTRADQITDVDATLHALVNPAGKPTTYHFEYGTDGPCSANPCTSTPDQNAGSSSSDAAVSKPISGLQPGTEYSFRLVATNSDSTSYGPDATFTTYGSSPSFDSCPNDEFRTGPSSKLPDCRAYEQASPINKNGSDVAGEFNLVQASPTGDKVTFFASSGLPGGTGAQDYTTYLAQRGSDAWTTSGLLPPASSGTAAKIGGWTSDLSHVFLDAAPVLGVQSAFLDRSSADGSITTVSPLQDQGSGVLIAMSSDQKLVYFETSAQLVPEAVPGTYNSYVWNRDTGDTALAGVLPDSACPVAPCAPVQGSVPGPGTSAQGISHYSQEEHAVSSSGDKFFFRDSDSENHGSGQLYLRKDAAGPDPETVPVSASQKTNGSGPDGTDPLGPLPATFHAAATDGSRAIFTSREKLTNDATTGPTDEGKDLYAYDSASGDLTDLTPDATDPNGADVQGVLGASSDAKTVYFAANGVLAPGATPGTCEPTGGGNIGGECSIYVGDEGDIAFVARLNANGSPSDAANWGESFHVGGTNDIARISRVSSDGDTLAFASDDQLTDYDNHGKREIYRYAAGTDELTCVSCNPTGVPPQGTTGLPGPSGTDYSHLQSIRDPTPSPPDKDGALIVRNLSDDGNRIFFESPEKLVAADNNANGGCPVVAVGAGSFNPRCQDVYEWEADGTGSCQSAEVNGGCLYLISTGTGSDPAFFADASADGDEVFIFTRERLVPQDQDNLRDVYSVAVDGGLPAQHESPPSGCQVEDCQGPPSTPPSDSNPGSTNAGSGNQGKDRSPPPTATNKKAKKCKKGKKGRKCRKARKHSRTANTNRGGTK